MLGWESFAAARASRKKRSTISCEVTSSGRMSLMATGLFRRTWVPRYTEPIPPRLRNPSIRYFPSRVRPIACSSEETFSLRRFPSSGQTLSFEANSRRHFGQVRIQPCYVSGAAGSNGRRALVAVQPVVEKQDRPVKDFGAVRDVLPGTEFLRGMAYAVATGDEDHPYRRNLRNLLGVLHGGTGQIHGGETQRLGRIADRRLEGRVCASGTHIVQSGAARLPVLFLVGLFESLLIT